MKKTLNRWVYLVIGTFALVFAGLIYAWSTFAPPIAKRFPEWNSAQMSLTATIVMCGFCIGGLLGGLLQKKLKPMVIMLMSSVLLILGFLLTSRTNSLVLLYIGFGVLAGLGSGISYNIIMSVVARWFPDKKGLCSGILLMGFGIGSFLLGKVYAAVTPEDGGDGWRTVFLIFGIVIFAVIVLSSFFMVNPPADWQVPASTKAGKQKEASFYQELPPGKMMKTRNFWLYIVWTLFMSGAGLMVIFQGNPIARETMQITGDATAAQIGTAATVVGLISIFNAIGRVIFGFLFDKIGRKLEMLIGGIMFIIGMLLTLVALSSHSMAILVIAYICNGLAYGSVTPTNAAFAMQFFGPKNYAVNLPIVNMNLLVASFSSTLSGAIYDATHSYNLIIYIVIALVVVGIIVNFLIRKPKDVN